MISIAEYINKNLLERQTHLKLDEDCIERGGYSTLFRGMLAHVLDTTIPIGNKILCCHACNNSKCSNPNHLYWGTYTENMKDFWSNQNNDIRDKRRKTLSENMSKINKKRNLKPWQVQNANVTDWYKAADVYLDKHLSNSKLRQKYNLCQGTTRTMRKLFNSGWNPIEDNDWCLFSDSNRDS